MEIGRLAAKSGVSASAIRYYESLGILPKPARSSGRRIYSDETFVLLRLIRAARSLGFRMQEMKVLFSGIASSRQIQKANWKQMAEAKLKEIRHKKNDLLLMEQILEDALNCQCLRIENCQMLTEGNA